MEELLINLINFFSLGYEICHEGTSEKRVQILCNVILSKKDTEILF